MKMMDIRQVKYYKYAKKIVIVLGSKVVILRKLRADQIIIVSVIILFFAQLVELKLSNDSDVSNFAVADIRKSIERYELENAILRAQSDEQLSYRVIATKAAELGLTKNGAERIINVK